MRLPQFAVWEWLDDNWLPMFIGVGEVKGGKHPAQLLWEKHTRRERGKVDSDLTRWLLTLDKEPTRSNHFPTAHLFLGDANQLAAARRLALKVQGYTLLSSRPYDTKAGGGSKKPVLAPNGDMYVSVRAAARDLGINACTITRWCNDSENGWSYLDDPSS